MKSAIGRGALCWLVTLVAALPALAQESALEGLGLRSGSGMPGLARVVVVLFAMIALAVAAALVLRRFWPSALRQTNGPVRIRAQLALGGNLKVHFVETGSVTLVVVEGRSGVAIAQLDEPPAESPPPDGGANDR